MRNIIMTRYFFSLLIERDPRDMSSIDLSGARARVRNSEEKRRIGRRSKGEETLGRTYGHQ